MRLLFIANPGSAYVEVQEVTPNPYTSPWSFYLDGWPAPGDIVQYEKPHWDKDLPRVCDMENIFEVLDRRFVLPPHTRSYCRLLCRRLKEIPQGVQAYSPP